MLPNILIIVLTNLFLVGGILWSIFLRRFGKTRLRFFTLLGALAVAIIGTVIIRKFVFTEALLPWIGIKITPTIAELLEISPSLMQVALGAAGGLATPLVFFALFLVTNLIAMIVYLIISMIRGAKMKEKEKANGYRYCKARTIILAVVQTLIIISVWLIPVSVYTSIAPIVMEEISDSGMLDESGTKTVDMILEDYIRPVDENNYVIGVFRVMGGRGITNAMTSFKVNGEKVKLEEELDSIASLATNISTLANRNISEYGSNEEESILAIADSFKNSTVLSVIVGEVAHAATDAWKDGEDFVGIEKDSVYIDESGMFNDFTDSLIVILNRDSAPGKEDALCEDLSTVADLVAIMIRSDIFANMGNQDALVESLSHEGVIKSLVGELGENSSMKVLIPEMTNIGVRAIGGVLELQADKEAVYNQMLKDITVGLNSAKKKDGEAQLNAVSDMLTESFDTAGLAVDKAMMPAYSAAMIESIVVPSGSNPVTQQDVRAFFAVYAWSLGTTPTPLQSGNSLIPLSAMASNDPIAAALAGTRYEGMSADMLAASGPAILARLSAKLSELSATEDLGEQITIRNEAAEIVEGGYLNALGAAGKKAIADAVEKAVASPEAVMNSAKLYNTKEMARITCVITMDELLVDVNAAAKKINAGTISKEAGAIDAIFEAAQTLAEETADGGELDMQTLAESIGKILNSLNDTVSFGRAKTDKLFTAVFQSETVRDSANLDMKTATQLAKDGSTGEKLDYQQTFKALFKTVDVMASMNKNNGELEETQIKELITEINPQSAAMIESFVTVERMEEEYDVPTSYAGTAAPLISNIFGYMGDAEMTEEEYEAEATAINNIMTVTMTARDNARDPDHSQSLFGEEGVLGKDAKSTVDELMSSASLAHSLNATEFEEDPFELSEVMANNQDTDEAEELKSAIREHYEENPTEETKETLGNLAKLFGVGNIDEILGIPVTP